MVAEVQRASEADGSGKLCLVRVIVDLGTSEDEAVTAYSTSKIHKLQDASTRVEDPRVVTVLSQE